MAITAEAPRGGVVDDIDGVSYTLILRNREIERFEDKHRGIFDLWDGFFGRGKKPTANEVKDILALALVGGGKKDADADAIIDRAGPDQLLQFYQISQAVVGIAFMPDAFTDDESKKKENETDSDQIGLMSEE